MRKIAALVVFACIGLSLYAQENRGKPPVLSYTAHHHSTTVTYGISTAFNTAPFIKQTDALSSKGSFVIGPVRVLRNTGISDEVSLNYGLVGMYFRDSYTYGPEYNLVGHANLMMGGIHGGANYHFVSFSNIDPYVGVSSGVGYIWGRHGADQAGRRLKGTAHPFYGGYAGVNLFGKKHTSSGLNLEAGYDYLAYFKLGYTFGKHR